MRMLSVLCLAAAAVVPPSLLRNDAPALEVRTTVVPVTRDAYQLLRRVKPGMYRCSAVVHEPGSERAMSVEDLVIGPGQSDQTARTFGPLSVELRASVSRSADRADTQVTVTRDGKIVSRQVSVVWLERPAAGVRPAQ